MSFQNWDKEFDEFWLVNSKVSKIYSLMGCFSPKYIMLELKRYRGAIFHDTKVRCKIWKKTDLWFGKWHEEFDKFSPEHTKFSKLGLSLNLFIQRRKRMSLKLTGELCVMAMKNDTKFEIELTCGFKTDMRNLTNFDPSTRKISKICTLMGWPKYIMFQLKRYTGIMFQCTQNWYKVWRKTGLCFQKLTGEIWQIFTRALESLWIGTLMASFCLKFEMYELKIYRGVMCHENEEWCKNWRAIDLSVQNWHEEFDKFLPEHSKISKICTLMGFFWAKYMFELKKSIGELFMFDGTEYWCKNWRKSDLCFQKWHEEFSEFSPEHVRKSKTWDFDGILLSKVENV